MRRQREQHYASHYHWIQLHFYPGLLAKLIKTGQQWSLILTPSHQTGSQKFQTQCGMSLAYLLLFFLDLDQVVAVVMAGGNIELPLLGVPVLIPF